jgi:hypothetical protein
MKLIIKRDQKQLKGLLGGNKGMLFQLSFRVELTTKEQELITRYRAENEPLTVRTTSKGEEVPGLIIGNLVRGVSYEVKDVGTILNNEQIVKEACESFKTLLTVMESFGGEEVVEY